ncbi:hypothetical protein RB653_003934 [Dictyostelium firmibasis]|uniref:Folylpolyglutamate synthase n=1 Tax=Dictyostelium firmibasis TaxID=79012 RepID=A0AAN7YXJ4_9MYCE
MLYSAKDRSYEESVNALLSLQSNQSVIVTWTKERRDNKEECTKMLMEEMRDYCKTLDIDLNRESIIHVAGTKGKGSTCAITESIIREQGFSTGLFTSPHLISVRERIRINGEMISKEMFSKYFWQCWDLLVKDFQTQLPNYFRYLTLMALKIFQDENIQCTILEVGIGGRMDSTNIFPKPMVTGISALGYDHQNLLGNTLAEIALEKAGIMKAGIPVFTVASQLPEAMNVLVNHSNQVKSPLAIVPSIDQYTIGGNGKIESIGLKGEHQLENASLAIALANCWFKKQNFKDSNEIFIATDNHSRYRYETNNYNVSQFTPLLKSIELGLKNCEWAGRAQHFTNPTHFPNMDFYLDGAHTVESSIVMLNWWKSIVKNYNNNNDTVYILLFNSTGGRNPSSFLKPIIQSINDKEIPIFDKAIIPNIIIEKPIDKKYYIKELTQATPSTTTPDNAASTTITESSTWEDFVVECYDKLSNKTHQCIPADSIESSIELAKELSENGTKNVKVLVTGSLYLVGGVLKVLLQEKSFN